MLCGEVLVKLRNWVNRLAPVGPKVYSESMIGDHGKPRADNSTACVIHFCCHCPPPRSLRCACVTIMHGGRPELHRLNSTLEAQALWSTNQVGIAAICQPVGIADDIGQRNEPTHRVLPDETPVYCHRSRGRESQLANARAFALPSAVCTRVTHRHRSSALGVRKCARLCRVRGKWRVSGLRLCARLATARALFAGMWADAGCAGGRWWSGRDRVGARCCAVLAIPQMRARSSGAREVVGVRAAIVRAADDCVRVCPSPCGCGLLGSGGG